MSRNRELFLCELAEGRNYVAENKCVDAVLFEVPGCLGVETALGDKEHGRVRALARAALHEMPLFVELCRVGNTYGLPALSASGLLCLGEQVSGHSAGNICYDVT